MIDKAIQYYLAKNTEVDYKTFETPAHTFFKRLYWNRKDIEDIIPECKKQELDDNFAKLNIDVSEEQVNNTRKMGWNTQTIIYLQKQEDRLIQLKEPTTLH